MIALDDIDRGVDLLAGFGLRLNGDGKLTP
jgi:hypothetical protein